MSKLAYERLMLTDICVLPQTLLRNELCRLLDMNLSIFIELFSVGLRRIGFFSTISNKKAHNCLLIHNNI